MKMYGRKLKNEKKINNANFNQNIMDIFIKNKVNQNKYTFQESKWAFYN